LCRSGRRHRGGDGRGGFGRALTCSSASGRGSSFCARRCSAESWREAWRSRVQPPWGNGHTNPSTSPLPIAPLDDSDDSASACRVDVLARARASPRGALRANDRCTRRVTNPRDTRVGVTARRDPDQTASSTSIRPRLCQRVHQGTGRAARADHVVTTAARVFHRGVPTRCRPHAPIEPTDRFPESR
jgi:hypothetical protein